jgi:NAD(P)-dependent dehydrogenase (short-subunit alcohol dehydrogenase family)
MRRLEGKRVLITGASSGIGAAAAQAFAVEGAHLALLARSRPGLEAVAARARSEGADAHVIVADVADRARVEAAVDEAATALGGLDIVVLNAAAMVFGRFWEVDAEAFDRTMDISFRGAVDTTRAALPHLRAGAGGSIVATGSIMARVPLPTFSSYTASKHALRGFLNTLRVELRSAGIPVMVSMVHPGAVDSPLWDHVSTRTGHLPSRPPDHYSPETIADALVTCAITGRKEFTVGGQGRSLELLHAFARPVAERLLVGVDRFYRAGRRPPPATGLIEGATGTGAVGGGSRFARRSAWAALRLHRP